MTKVCSSCKEENLLNCFVVCQEAKMGTQAVAKLA